MLKQRILGTLKEEEFALYIKAVNEHKSYKQIAEEMSISYDAVKGRITRLRKKLKLAAKLATTPVGLLILKLFF
jgi:DNA-directed RNA polymerase specialized sigma24 family protein